MYVGQTLRMFFEEEKPALLQQIDAEFEKVCFTPDKVVILYCAVIMASSDCEILYCAVIMASSDLNP